MNDAELLTDLSELIINMTNTLRPVRSAVDTWLCIKKAIKGTLRRHGVHKANLARDRKLRLKQELETLAAQAQRQPENNNILMQQTLLMKQDNSRVKELLDFGKKIHNWRN